MIIDEKIRAAISKLADEFGQVQTFCEEVGLNTRQFHGYRGRNPRWASKKIPEEVWERLYPHLKKFLPEGPEYLPRETLVQLVNDRDLDLRRQAHRLYRSYQRRDKKRQEEEQENGGD